MGLFDRRVKEEEVLYKNAIQVNNIDETAYFRPFTFKLHGKGKKDFASLFFYTILEKIFNGLRNISFRSTEINYTADDVVNFVDNNAQLLVHHYFRSGYACIVIDKWNLRMPYTNEVRLDANGRVINRNMVVVYSDPYILERKSHYMIMSPLIDAINNNLNNSDFVTSNLGLFGILHGKGLPISPQAKQETLEMMKKKYGYGEDKFQFILSNAELDFKPINIPVDQLKLNENVDFQLKQIWRFFGINPDYIYGGSTFTNQAESVRSFYKECIIPLAEVLLSLARNVYIKMNTSDKPSTIITYTVTNVPEFNKTLSSACEEKSAYLDYLLKLREAGVDVEDDIRRLYEDSRHMLQDV